jgi:hypothetical protein
MAKGVGFSALYQEGLLHFQFTHMLNLWTISMCVLNSLLGCASAASKYTATGRHACQSSAVSGTLSFFPSIRYLCSSQNIWALAQIWLYCWPTPWKIVICFKLMIDNVGLLQYALSVVPITLWMAVFLTLVRGS